MVNNYKDLIIWQKSHKIAMEVFAMFKQSKKTGASYEIWKQLIRSTFSVPANIFEGYYSHKGLNYASRLNTAKGEAGESDYWLLVLSETGDVSKETYESLSNQILEVIKMLSGMRNKLIAK